jgi:hypothetical protein
MFIRARDGRRPRELTPRPAGLSARVAGEEDQAVLADLDLVAVRQLDLVDAVAVDVGAVERADVAHVKPSPARWNSACRRETVTSSRKISLSGAGRR